MNNYHLYPKARYEAAGVSSDMLLGPGPTSLAALRLRAAQSALQSPLPAPGTISPHLHSWRNEISMLRLGTGSLARSRHAQDRIIGSHFASLSRTLRDPLRDRDLSSIETLLIQGEAQRQSELGTRRLRLQSQNATPMTLPLHASSIAERVVTVPSLQALRGNAATTGTKSLTSRSPLPCLPSGRPTNGCKGSDPSTLARLVHDASIPKGRALYKSQDATVGREGIKTERPPAAAAEDCVEPDDVYFASFKLDPSFGADLACLTDYDMKQSKENFPMKLYRMLYETEKRGQSDIVSFLKHGFAFKIHDQERFVSEVMPLYFTAVRLNTFMKQLGLYRFHRITTGPEKNAYFHHDFVKGKREWCSRILRKKTRIPKAVLLQREREKEQQRKEEEERERKEGSLEMEQAEEEE